MGDGEGRIRTTKACGFETLTERTILSKLILWAANGHFVTAVEYYAQPSVQIYTRLQRVPWRQTGKSERVLAPGIRLFLN